MIVLVSLTARLARMIPVSSEDFQRLCSHGSETKIFWKMTRFGAYWYVTSVGGTQICTKTKQRIQFPDTCELFLIKPTKNL